MGVIVGSCSSDSERSSFYIIDQKRPTCNQDMSHIDNPEAL